MHDDVDLFLAHYGIRGMHWGIRKDDKGTPNKVGLKGLTPAGPNTAGKTTAQIRRQAKVRAALRGPGQRRIDREIMRSFDPKTKDNSARNKKIAIGVGVGAVTIGAVAVGVYLKTHGNVPVSTLPKSDLRAEALIKQNYRKKMQDIVLAKDAKKLTEDQARRLQTIASVQYVNARTKAHGNVDWARPLT